MAQRSRSLAPLGRRAACGAAVVLAIGATAACSDPWPTTRPADFAVEHAYDAGESFIAKSSIDRWRAVSAALDRLRAEVLSDRAKP